MTSHRFSFAGGFRSILCPVDFSKHSKLALRYAAAIANRSHGGLTVLFVNDPLLAAAVHVASTVDEENEKELRRFVSGALKADAVKVRAARLVVTKGQPAREIVKVAARERCDLIVMGTHGLGAAARLFFGSTTQGVLRQATIPVLAIPPEERAKSARPRPRAAGRKRPSVGFVARLATELARAAQERDRVEMEAIGRLVPPRKRQAFTSASQRHQTGLS